MSEEKFKAMMEYIDSRIKRLEGELELMKCLREILENRIKRLGTAAERASKEREGLLAILSNANWRRYPSGEGEWCFADELPGNFVKELRERGSMDLNRYRYVYRRLSGGKEIVSRKALRGL
jgi:hypothetical protein